MKKLMAVLVTGLLALPAVAAAETAWTTDYVNLRAGPDVDYPRITFLQPGEPVEVYGCLEDYTWCDVDAVGERGWVSAEYLDFEYDDGSRVRVDRYGATVGLAVVSFVLGSYWEHHYHARPWYPQLGYWRARHPHHWAPPPPRHYVRAPAYPPRHYGRAGAPPPVARPMGPRPHAGPAPQRPSAGQWERRPGPQPPRAGGYERGDRRPDGQWRAGNDPRPAGPAPQRPRQEPRQPGSSAPPRVSAPMAGNRPNPPTRFAGTSPGQRPQGMNGRPEGERRFERPQSMPRSEGAPQRQAGQWQPPSAMPARVASAGPATHAPRPQPQSQPPAQPQARDSQPRPAASSSQPEHRGPVAGGHARPAQEGRRGNRIPPTMGSR